MPLRMGWMLALATLVACVPAREAPGAVANAAQTPRPSTSLPGLAASDGAPPRVTVRPGQAAQAEEGPTGEVSLDVASPAPTQPPVTVAGTQEAAWLTRLRAEFVDRRVSGLAALALNREAEGPVTRAIGFNVPASHQPEGFLWNEGDRTVEEWMPQGIGGFERDGRRWLAVTWYAKDLVEDTEKPAEALSYRGARLTLVDITDPKQIRYRHVLLVQDAANLAAKGLFRLGAVARSAYTQGAGFAPVPVHAGGVEVYGHWVYVVDTQLGVRVFDLDQMLTAEADEAKATCGVVDGRLYAFDYRFVVPQIAHYKVTGAAPYSCLSLDETSMTLWMGQYLGEKDAARTAITGIPLGADGRLAAAATAMTFPKDKDGVYAHRIQGAFRRGNRTWMSMTGQTLYEGSSARLALYEDGAGEGARWRWPHGAEDLYYEASRDTLWCLTEFPKSQLIRRDRSVFGVKLSTYTPE